MDGIINADDPKLSDPSEDKIAPGWQIWKHRRYVIAMLVFLGYVIAFSTTTNLSIAILAMTEKKPLMLENGTTIFTSEFDWDIMQQGYALSAFFYGLLLSQIPMGFLSVKFGGYIIFGTEVALSAVISLLTPLFAETSLFLLIIARFVQGLVEGGYPACALELFSKWVPPLERSRLMNLTFPGLYLSSALTNMISPYLIRAMGWRSIFYVIGGAEIIWLALWYTFAAASPDSDKMISEEELSHIQSKIENTVPPKMTQIPWKAMLTSIHLWTIIVAHVAHLGWGFYFRVTMVPALLKETLHFELEETGIIACIPFLIEAFASPPSGYLADWLLTKKFSSTTKLRKIFTCFSFFIQTLSSFVGAFWFSAVVIPVCLILGSVTSAFAFAGYVVNYLDIAPQYAAIMFGIGSTMSTTAGIVCPLLAGYILTDMSYDQWRIMFCITGGTYLFAGIFYAIFASADIQPWALSKDEMPEFGESQPSTVRIISYSQKEL